MIENLIAWILRAVSFGTIIMYGCMGETITEKSGNLNLGVPGIMYLGGFAGFAGAYYYEELTAKPNAVLCILIAVACGFLAAAFGGLIFSFLTITLRANQNVTGLALTTFGMGVANFFGVMILNGGTAGQGGFCQYGIYRENPISVIARHSGTNRIFLWLSCLCGDFACSDSALCFEPDAGGTESARSRRESGDGGCGRN